MQRLFGRSLFFAAALFTALLWSLTPAFAQYEVHNLTANQMGKAANFDANIVNAWGLTSGANSPFWVSDQVTGVSTLYNAQGAPQPLVVSIPAVEENKMGSPTGIVFNGSGDFVVKAHDLSGPAIFIFATLDGTISGWNPTVDPTHAILAPNQPTSGAVYTGLAIAPDLNWLYAADAAGGKVDVYDGKFNPIFTFSDNEVPENFTPYGIRVIDKKVFVTFASPTNLKGGVIDVFDEFGKFQKRLVTNGPLNQPWGLALAPADFGPFSNALLVGNNLPEGTINAFNLETGKFLGKLKDTGGKTIVIDQLWGLDFGKGADVNGKTNQLFFTAGPDNYSKGLFGMIQLRP
jgi:uncharacterized protein (TIGR03118 family)